SGASGAAGGTAPTGVYSPVDAEGELTHGRGLGGVQVNPGIEIEEEYIYNIPIVDVRKYFNCFDLVPNEGAIYTIQLCVDVPVNSDPDMSMNFSGGVSAGHTFLVVTKTGGGVSVSQSFGFYPQTAPSMWNPFSSIPSTIKDNGNKEINASITMNINAD